MKSFNRKLKAFSILIFVLIAVSGFFFSQKKFSDIEAYSYVYETENTILSDLFEDETEIETSYNLSNYYPLVCENQTTSSLCWLYASLKSLESSLMVQTDEFYNFSEVGMAYLFYLSKSHQGSLNTSGTFEDFVKIYQDYGLILESDFSNNEYSDINSSNYTKYLYACEFATKEYNEMLKPYEINEIDYYQGLSVQSKRKVIKNYIKNYGGLFAGIERGYLYQNNGNNFYTNDLNKQLVEKEIISADHAICVIGWNDTIEIGAETGAFLVMNSWGLESNSYEQFYVPYNYVNFYSTFAGFVCDETVSQQVKIEDSGNSSFTTKILSGSKQLDNFFCYDDTNVSVTYKINQPTLDNITVKVVNGKKDFSRYFSTNFNNSDKTIKVSLNVSDDSFYGGYYTIKFFKLNEYIGQKSIYIYSGTETGYFKIWSNGIDCYALQNSFLNAENSATLNFSTVSGYYYFFEFNLTNLNEHSTLENCAISSQKKSLSMLIDDVSITCSGNESKENYNSDYLKTVFFSTSTNDLANIFRIQFGYADMNLFSDCMLKFKLTINSTVYEDCSRDFYFNIFLSGRVNAKTENLNNIFYELDGGKNPDDAISKYPNYLLDTSMTTVDLPIPTKQDANFMGWYTSPDLLEIAKVDVNSTLSGDIVLYARWEDVSIDYFDISLSLVGAKNYNGTDKSITDSIIYGDSIVVRLNFTEKSPLSVYPEYEIYYFFYGLDELPEGAYLQGTSKDFSLNFPELKSGMHNFIVKVDVKISQSFTVSKTRNVVVAVAKKPVGITFTNLTAEYDGQVHTPTIFMTTDFYQEDRGTKTNKELVNLQSNAQAINAGVYNFVVSSLVNENYTFDAESSKCSFEITKKPITLKWKPYNQVYDGYSHLPEYEITGLVSGDRVSFTLTLLSCVDAGNYTINIKPDSISNSNYMVSSVSDFDFEIKKANITIVMNNTKDRVQTKVGRRLVPTYKITGKYYSIEDLKLNIISDGLSATRSGIYKISCSVGSQNYNYTVQDATYTLSGYYYIYYQLKNGTSYAERVEEGETPIGVTKEQLKTPLFSKISYSDDYEITGNDIYVAVSVEDYSAEVYTFGFVAIFLVICLIYYFKKRESRVR